jgi:hypothetical protein
MRYHHTFIEGLFKFAIGEVFVDCAEWRSLLERAIAGATQCTATTTIELRQRLSVGKVIGQNRRSGEDDDENCNRVAHLLTFNAGTDCSAPNIRSYIPTTSWPSRSSIPQPWVPSRFVPHKFV